jgi:hypothetical protein
MKANTFSGESLSLPTEEGDSDDTFSLPTGEGIIATDGIVDIISRPPIRFMVF